MQEARYASGRDRRGQLASRGPISERPQHIDARSQQIGYWEGDTVIRAVHKQAVLILVAHKSGYAVLDKVRNKILNLIISAIITQLAP